MGLFIFCLYALPSPIHFQHFFVSSGPEGMNGDKSLLYYFFICYSFFEDQSIFGHCYFIILRDVRIRIQRATGALTAWPPIFLNLKIHVQRSYS
jgi:hypothetical protein